MTMRVLILEPDEELLSEMLAYIRRTTDFDCEAASTGEQCIDRLDEFRPDVLVLEPSLPDESSDRVLDAVARSSHCAVLPVLVLTRMSHDALTKDHELISEYLIKPQALNDIVETIRRLAVNGTHHRAEAGAEYQQ